MSAADYIAREESHKYSTADKTGMDSDWSKGNQGGSAASGGSASAGGGAPGGAAGDEDGEEAGGCDYDGSTAADAFLGHKPGSADAAGAAAPAKKEKATSFSGFEGTAGANRSPLRLAPCCAELTLCQCPPCSLLLLSIFLSVC